MTSDHVATIKKLLSETYGGLVMAHDAARYSELYAEDVLWARPTPRSDEQRGHPEGHTGAL